LTQTAHQKAVQIALRKKGVSKVFNNMEDDHKFAMFRNANAIGSDGGYADLRDFPLNKTDSLAKEIKDYQVRKINQDREHDSIRLSNAKFSEKYQKIHGKTSQRDLEKQMYDLRKQHSNEYDTIERKKNSDLPDSSLKKIQHKHHQTNRNLNGITNEISRRKSHGRYSKVYY